MELCHSLLNFYHLPSLPDLVIFPLAYGPLIYLYTQFLVKPNTKLSTKMGYHFIPLALFLFIPVFWGSPISIQTNDFFSRGAETYLGMINFLVFLFSIVYYFSITLQLIKTHKINLSNQFSYENESNTLNWLWITSIALLVFPSVSLGFDKPIFLPSTFLIARKKPKVPCKMILQVMKIWQKS
jgi:hypothetical protein